MEVSDLAFGGLAALYGALASFAVLAGLWLCGQHKNWRIWPLLFTTFTFLFLTQHPFPPLDGLVCPLESAEPQLVPFKFLRSFARPHYQDIGLRAYFTNRIIAASVMNFVLCLAIGLALSRHTKSIRVASLYGGCLTLGVELTQLTGIWGLYPCAYRQFNVDDLVLNAAGVLSGVIIGSFWRARGVLS